MFSVNSSGHAEPEVEQSSYWFVFASRLVPVFSHCFDQEESLTDQGSPLLQASILLFWGLSSSVSHLSGYQRGNTPATSRAGNIVGHGCFFTWLCKHHHQLKLKYNLCCFVFHISITDCFFIFHNDANKLKGSKCTLRQISLSLLSPDITTVAFKRTHEIMMHTYFK